MAHLGELWWEIVELFMEFFVILLLASKNSLSFEKEFLNLFKHELIKTITKKNEREEGKSGLRMLYLLAGFVTWRQSIAAACKQVAFSFWFLPPFRLEAFMLYCWTILGLIKDKILQKHLPRVCSSIKKKI